MENNSASSSEIAAAAHEVVGWLAAQRAGIERFNEISKIVTQSSGIRTYEIPLLGIGLRLPDDRDVFRYRPQPRRHTVRDQRGSSVQHWVFASTGDATMTVAVARVESGEPDDWSAYVSRGPHTQFVDRFAIGKAPTLPVDAAPFAAHIALLIADVVTPLQAEIEKLLKP